MTILVLGGRGTTGRRIADRLDQRGFAVRLGSRSGQPPFSWENPASWPAVLDGARAVYLVQPPEHVDTSVVTKFVEQLQVERVVLLSARGADFAGEPVAETAVRDRGLPWTVLRPAWFNQNFDETLFSAELRSGELALPAGEGREAFVDAEDIADVAVAALTEDRHAGQVYELSGPEALSFGDALARISEASGLPLRYRHTTAADYAAGRVAAGMSRELADLLAMLLAGVSEGWGGYVSDGVERALGRPPRGFDDYVRRCWAQPR